MFSRRRKMHDTPTLLYFEVIFGPLWSPCGHGLDWTATMIEITETRRYELHCPVTLQVV